MLRVARISALLVPYNVANSYNETFVPGVFAPWLNELGSLPMFRNHGEGANTKCGVWSAFYEKPDGLYADGRVYHPGMVGDLADDADRAIKAIGPEVSIAWFLTGADGVTADPGVARPGEMAEHLGDFVAMLATEEFNRERDRSDLPNLERLLANLSDAVNKAKKRKVPYVGTAPHGISEASLVRKGAFPGTWWKLEGVDVVAA